MNKTNNMRRFLVWGGGALVLILLPLVFPDDFARSLLSRMGIAIIFALSYNMLLGQGGMLSFGHAVYSGLGAYFTIHALNAVSDGAFVFPVTLLPIIGGLAGLFFGIIFGYVTTKRSGTPFAMISLGIGELVAASALMLPSFFGGEAGISGNRVVGEPWLGIDYGSQVQVYYLIAAWMFLCIIGMYAFTQTPLGRMSNAVRDNPERVQFIGYDTHMVRFFTLAISGFFAGIAGGLSAINFEIVTAENVGAHASGGVLLMTFIGGVGQFFGPMIGAVLVTFLQTALSDITKAWLFYFGLLFLTIVLFAPGGFSSLIVLHKPVWQAGLMRRLVPSYLFAAVTGLVLLVGVIALVEINYHLSEAPGEPAMSLFGVGFNADSVIAWLVILALVSASLFVLLRFVRSSVALAWQGATQELHQLELARAGKKRDERHGERIELEVPALEQPEVDLPGGGKP